MSYCSQLIPRPQGGRPAPAGTGQSKFGRDLMANVVRDHFEEASAIAECLREGKSLEEALSSFHQFVYDNFNRITEGRKHYLQTLSRAWYDRSMGINCEDATIILAQLCLASGIQCRIRGIAQRWPNVVNHVYLIVPKNQRTGSLKEGYFTVDGTLPNFNIEAPRIAPPRDVVMKEATVEYFVMNGTDKAPCGCQSQLSMNEGGGDSKMDPATLSLIFSAAVSFLKNINPDCLFNPKCRDYEKAMTNIPNQNPNPNNYFPQSKAPVWDNIGHLSEAELKYLINWLQDAHDNSSGDRKVAFQKAYKTYQDAAKKTLNALQQANGSNYSGGSGGSGSGNNDQVDPGSGKPQTANVLGFIPKKWVAPGIAMGILSVGGYQVYKSEFSKKPKS